MIKARTQTIIWFLIVFFIYIYSDSYFGLFLLSISTGIFIFLGISMALIKDNIGFRLNLPETMDKNTFCDCHLEVENTKILPISKIKCTFQLENCLTDQIEEKDVYFSLRSKARERIYWEIESRYCGKIEVSIKELVYYDYFGVFTKTIKPDISRDILVLPDTFYMDISISESKVENLESPIYSNKYKGIDKTEIFGIKEYRIGDDVKNIHWKLSSKLDDLIIKELNTNIDDSILVIMETSTLGGMQKESPGVSDAMMEAFVSVSRSLLENNYTHSVGWFAHEYNSFMIEEVNSMEDLSGLVGGFLQIEKKENPYSSMEYYFNKSRDTTYAHIIYICSWITEEYARELSQQYQVSILKCQSSSEDMEIGERDYIKTFTPNSIKEDLNQLII